VRYFVLIAIGSTIINIYLIYYKVVGSNPVGSTNGIKAHKDVQTLNRVRLGFEFQIFHKKNKKSLELIKKGVSL
jgi:hypothetical protein